MFANIWDLIEKSLRPNLNESRVIGRKAERLVLTVTVLYFSC